MEFFKLKFWAIPFAFASLQGLFLMGILFFHKSKSQLSNILLGMLTFFVSCILGYMALYISDQLMNYPHLIWTTSSFWYVLGPLFYVYLKTRFKVELRWYDSLHFIPFLYKFFLFFPFLLRSAKEKIKIYSWLTEQYELSYDAFLHYLISTIYIFFSYLFLKKIEKRYKSSSSSSYVSIIDHHKNLTKILGISLGIIYIAILCSP